MSKHAHNSNSKAFRLSWNKPKSYLQKHNMLRYLILIHYIKKRQESDICWNTLKSYLHKHRWTSYYNRIC